MSNIKEAIDLLEKQADFDPDDRPDPEELLARLAATIDEVLALLRAELEKETKEKEKLQPKSRPATQCEKELAKCLCDCQDKCHKLQAEVERLTEILKNYGSCPQRLEKKQ